MPQSGIIFLQNVNEVVNGAGIGLLGSIGRVATKPPTSWGGAVLSVLGSVFLCTLVCVVPIPGEFWSHIKYGIVGLCAVFGKEIFAALQKYVPQIFLQLLKQSGDWAEKQQHNERSDGDNDDRA